MVKVLSLNLNYYVEKHGPWPGRRDQICRVLRETAPDIVAFQAVARDPRVDSGRDQAAELADLLPEYRYTHFQPAVTGAGGTAQGSAFLSRWPPVSADCRRLSLRPGLEDTSPRLLLSAAFEVPAGGGEAGARNPSAVRVFNAHFSWVRDQAADNIREALGWLRSFSGPAVLVGDLNTTPESDLWTSFREAGWTDAWALLRPSDPGLTFESDKPSIRIDYAWVNEALKPHLEAIEVVGHAVSDRARLSDHLALLLTLAV